MRKLYDKWPEEYAKAKEEALLAELGDGKSAISGEAVDERITRALNNNKNWLLIGGPPCQAYSIAGRSRRKERKLDEKKDERVGLYKQYLRILAVHNPAVFIMENVKGLLSAETEESPIFQKILNDLKNPTVALVSGNKRHENSLICPGYKVYSLCVAAESFDDQGNPVYKHRDYIIHAEKYGIPQARHRIILLGIRNDINIKPENLEVEKEVPVSKVLSGLPKLRSGLSKKKDDDNIWLNSVSKLLSCRKSEFEREIFEGITKEINRMKVPTDKAGSDYLRSKQINIKYLPEWFLDERVGGVCNHSARSHMESDLHRYLFISCYAKLKNESPRIHDFPECLLPDHKMFNRQLMIINLQIDSGFNCGISLQDDNKSYI